MEGRAKLPQNSEPYAEYVRPEVVLSCAWCDRPAKERVHPIYGLQYRCDRHYGCTCRPPGQAFHEPDCARRKGR